MLLTQQAAMSCSGSITASCIILAVLARRLDHPEHLQGNQMQPSAGKTSH